MNLRATIRLAAVVLTGMYGHAMMQAQVDPRSLDGKLLFGYQGWFNCAGDGAPENNWRSWARGVPAPDTLTIDMYPDLREFDPADLSGWRAPSY